MRRFGFALGRSVGGALCAGALLLARPALAQNTPDEMARRHFESGAAYLQESDYERALTAFQKAYDLSKRPEILVNIATVQERQGNLADAVASLERYLSEAPEGEHAETVKIRIANLKKRMETEPSTVAPPQPAEPPPAPVATPPAPPVAAPPPAPPPPAPAEPNRVPAYIAFGLGAVAGTGAILTGIFAQSEYNDAEETCGNACSDDQVASGRTLALTSTVLTGVAVLGAAVGATLWFTAGSEPSPSAAGPRFGVDVGPAGAGARARWAF